MVFRILTTKQTTIHEQQFILNIEVSTIYQIIVYNLSFQYGAICQYIFWFWLFCFQIFGNKTYIRPCVG